MFLSKNKKNNIYPCKPQFYYIKWVLRGSKLYRHVFVMKNGVNATDHLETDPDDDLFSLEGFPIYYQLSFTNNLS